MTEFKQLSLRQAHQFDVAYKHPELRWTQICAERAKSSSTRRARVLRNKANGIMNHTVKKDRRGY